jgi:hypothetical protein
MLTKKPKTLATTILACLTLGSLLSVNTEAVNAATFTMQFGDIDAFDSSNGPEDPTMQRSEQIDRFYQTLPNCISPPTSAWQRRCEFREFDEQTSDKNLLHYFDLSSPLAAGKIVSATLETRLRATGAYNDGFLLGLPSNGDYWYGRIGKNNQNNINFLTDTWTYGQDQNFSLDLSNLPTFDGSGKDLLPMLNQIGFLDIEIQDDTTVDYLKLTVETKPVPEPTSVAGLAVLGLGFVGSKARKFFCRS